MTQTAVTVSQLNEYIKNLFSADRTLSNVYITGEISNFKRHSSGHLYFTLKDEESVISAIMFRGDAMKMRFAPNSGMKVLVFGKVSVYPKSGQYQVYVTSMQPDGIGSLYMAFEQLKEKLYKMGLFEASHKKQLPKFPQKIALITSPTGAAVRDMIRILRHRYPICDIIVCPVKVQGIGAAEEIAGMIGYVNEYKLCDLIITGRGGGSLEDLWAFNEEIVALAIHKSTIPVISAVGHEPDITISDYVADKRAATPSNAAEIAVCDQNELIPALRDLSLRIERFMRSRIEGYRQRLQAISQKPVMESPYEYLNEQRMHLALIEQQLSVVQNLAIERGRHRYCQIAASLEALSPLKVLSRGYSMVSGKSGVIKSSYDINAGDSIKITFADGYGKCTVDSVAPNEKEKNDG
ncbi:MAG: exodeoxyribonuclease VII large subunit [Clostridiaceae bacterium]|nr:exodeoxyribonuclease VII large subunit [Clostridiaceae bacterium]